MTDTRTAGKELQGQILDTVRKSQETVLEAIKAWTDAVQAITPPVPAFAAPLTDKLPKPADLVADAYDFAEQLLHTQRKFAEEVLQATEPLTSGKTTANWAATTQQ